MRTKAEIISRLVKPGIIAVVRAQKAEQVPPLCEALLAGGVLAIEITMTTPNALAAIRDARARFGERALIGAEFVVTPICRIQLVKLAQAADRPIMLGAYTPTEAQLAHEAGADFVKIFPADTLGPGFIKSLRAPLPHLKIVPTGGVDVGNVADFLKAGCAALGVGSSLVSTKILADADWPELTRRAKEFVKAANTALVSS